MAGQVEQLERSPTITADEWKGYQHFIDPTLQPFNTLTYPSQNCSMPSFDKIVPDKGKKLLGQDWTENIGVNGNKEKYTTLGGTEIEVRVSPSELALEITIDAEQFTIGETIVGSDSNATATVVSKSNLDAFNGELIVKDIFGIFMEGETITGQSSSSTAEIVTNDTTRGDMIEVLFTDPNPFGTYYNIPHWYTISELEDNPLPRGLHRYSFDQWFDTNLNPSESLNIPRLVWVNGNPQVYSWIGGIAPIVDVTDAGGSVYLSVDVGTMALFEVTGVLSSYSETHQDITTALFAGATISEGQSFQCPSNATLAACKFFLKKLGAPTGNVTATLYASTGTLGVNSKPTGLPLAVSDNVNIATLTTNFALIPFTFSGINQIALNSGVNYVIVVNYNGGDGSNNLILGLDNSAPTHPGNSSSSGDDVAWTVHTQDICFYIYGILSGGSPFTNGEVITGSMSGATALISTHSNNFSPLTLVRINGEFVVDEVITGSISGSSGTVLDYTAPTITWASLGFIDPSVSGYADDANIQIRDFSYEIESGWDTSTVVVVPGLPEIFRGDVAFSMIRADDAPIPFDFCRQTKNYMYYGNWKNRQLYQSNAFSRDADGIVTIQQADLDDLFIPETSAYNGLSSATFRITIDAAGTPDTFSWSKDGGSPTTGVAITGAAQDLSDGVQIQFVATTGHSVGDYWEIEVVQAIEDAWFNFYYTLPVRRPGEGYIFRLPSNFWTMDIQEDKLYVNSKYGEWSVIDTILSSDLQSETVSLTPLKQSGSLKVIDPWMTGHMEDNLVFVTLDKSLMNMGRQAFLQEPQDGYMSDPVKYDFLPCSFIGGGIKYIGKRLYITSPEQGIMHCLDVAKGYWQPPKTFPEMGIPSIVGNDLIMHSNIRNRSFTMFASNSDFGQAYLVQAKTPFNAYFKLVNRHKIPARWDSKFSSNSFIEGYLSGNPQLVFTAFEGVNDSVGASHPVNPVFQNALVDRASIGEASLGTHPLGNDLAIDGDYFNEIYDQFKPILNYYFIALQIACISKNHSYSIVSMGVNMSFTPTGNNTLIGDREVL